MEGSLKWFDEKKLHGFLEVPRIGDVLVHRDEIVDYDALKAAGKIVPGAKFRFFVVSRLRAVQATIMENNGAKPEGG